MAANQEHFDLVVVGGGLGGLAAAGLARAAGLSTALLEAHTKLGGCAGYFERDDYVFDAGATALMGLGRGEPLRELVDTLGMDFQGVPTGSYRVHLPDHVLDIVPDRDAFERGCDRVFEGNRLGRRLFWRLQEFVGSTLFEVAGKVPRLPARSVGDLAHDLRILGLSGLLAAGTWPLTTLDVMRAVGVAGDKRFRALIAMLLQDTAQAGPETVPFANAAACLHAYRSGMCRPRGGMKALAEGIGRRFTELGGDLRRATIVDAVARTREGFVIRTRRRQELLARRVVFNLPLDLAAKLLGRPLAGRTARIERRSRAAWSAFTAYVAFDRSAVPDDAPLFHQVLGHYDRPIHEGNNVLVSLSPPGDLGYGPDRVRVATMSTHVDSNDWMDLSESEHAARKADHADRMLSALARALPNARESLIHAEFATPRSFRRYTRRTNGAVGGPPVRRTNSVFLAAGPDVFGDGIRLVGDSVFPGQGTMAVILSARRVVEEMVADDACRPTFAATNHRHRDPVRDTAIRSLS